jgi:hypothetical protein
MPKVRPMSTPSLSKLGKAKDFECNATHRCSETLFEKLFVFRKTVTS